VKIDVSDRISSEESGEDIKLKTEETETCDSVVDQADSAEDNVQKECAILDDSENIAVDQQ
jgi:hypothetical protein